MLSGNPDPPPPKKKNVGSKEDGGGGGGGHLFTSVFSHTPLSSAIGGGNTAAQPVCSAKDDRYGQIPDIPDTKPVPRQ